MKRKLVALLSALGLFRPEVKGQDLKTIDPSNIRYTVPTISDDLAPVESIELPLSEDAFTLHEDDWCQVEFFTMDRSPELQRMLKEYKAFEAKNRTSSGWKNVYVRRIERSPLLVGEDAVTRLGSSFGSAIEGAPILHSTTTVTGMVVDGFTISLGGNVHLYGYKTASGIPVLAASVGKDPDDTVLTTAFAKLNREAGLVLIDWKQQIILMGVEPSRMIQVWRP